MIPDLFNPVPDGADALRPGYYLLKKRRAGRIDVPVRIWFGPPLDPVTAEPLDRAPRWQVEINGVLLADPDHPPFIGGFPVDSLEGIWPECATERIDDAEYRYRVARAEWAELHDPNDPFAGTGARVDPMTATLPF